ncbi:hypothetical protein C8R45DRAFT_464380 [Mycena sanguinolenta]|nr:hypothetical protein C8R45DRAFT_464380 [Mycena sanguinolenta]
MQDQNCMMSYKDGLAPPHPVSSRNPMASAFHFRFRHLTVAESSPYLNSLSLAANGGVPMQTKSGPSLCTLRTHPDSAYAPIDTHTHIRYFTLMATRETIDYGSPFFWPSSVCRNRFRIRSWFLPLWRPCPGNAIFPVLFLFYLFGGGVCV